MPLFYKKYNHFSDEQLMPLIAKGKERAFEELYVRYNKRMYNYFYRMLGQSEEYAHDATQDLFIRLFQNAYRFDKGKKCSTWIYAIASNMCKNTYRKWARMPIIRELTAEEDKGINEMFSENLDRIFFHQELQQALDELEWKHRECFVLRYQDELSVREISTILQCPEGTVKSRIHYALKKLARKLALFKNTLDPHSTTPSYKAVKKDKGL